jgi:hypothetical protein
MFGGRMVCREIPTLRKCIREGNLMAHVIEGRGHGWARLDRATFGLIYGAITVLSLLMAMGPTDHSPLMMAGVLFGSVLAITLANAFALVMEETVTGAPAIRPTFSDAWRHSRPTLVAANVPTLLIAGAGLGLLSVEEALLLGEVFTISLLGVLGGRVGWVVGQRSRAALLGALFTGGIGVALAGTKHILAGIKYLLH